MINKQNLWFLTLFSLIMVLSIYYLTMSDETLQAINVSSVNSDADEVVITESDTLVALRVANEEELLSKIEALEDILLDDAATVEEKNDAYEELQTINKNESQKDEITSLIKETYDLDSVVEINDSTIKVTIASSDHNTTLANNIIRSVQSLYDKEIYITVKFNET